MIGAVDKPWTARDHALVLAILREPRPVLPEERIAASRLFVAEFLNWYEGISHQLALAAYRAGHKTVAKAQNAGIVPPGARWRCARGLAGVVFGAPGLSSAGPP